MKALKKVRKEDFTDIFGRYYHLVFNAVYTKVGNKHDAEDICQEVFIALYNSLEDVENVRKWLFGTLRNKVCNFYRDRNPNIENIDDMFQDISLAFVNGFKDVRIIISSAIDDEIKDENDRELIELLCSPYKKSVNLSK